MTQTIDSAWLSANATAFGGPPYILGQDFSTYAADTNYVLSLAVTTDGSSFIPAAAGVTLSLNSHIVTFNNATPPTVVNPDFETDSVGATTITGWTYTPVGGITVAIASNSAAYLFGSKVLSVHGLSSSGTQTIIVKQAAIAMPAANVGLLMAARVAMSVLGGTSAYSDLDSFTAGAYVLIKVYDDVTNTLLATGTDGQGHTSGSYQNFKCDGSVATWVPANTHDIRIELTFGVLTATTTTIYADHVRVGAAACFGVACGFDMLGMTTNLPANMTFPGAQAPFRGSSPTILGPGSIVQGAAKGYGCAGAYFDTLQSPAVVDGVTFTLNGDDTQGIYRATNGDSNNTASSTITNSTITYSGDVDVLNRAFPVYAISLQNSPGNTVVTGNTITNTPQGGIILSVKYSAGGTGGGFNNSSAQPTTTHLIDSNIISVNATVSNSYAIGLSGAYNATLSNNTITTSASRGGEGIAIDAQTLLDFNTVAVHGNTVNVNLGGAREYGFIQSRALRMRNDAGPGAAGGFIGVSVYSNTLVSHNTTSDGPISIGAWITILTTSGNASAQVSFHDNIIKGITDQASGGGTFAGALVIDGIVNGCDPVFKSNTCESNDTSIQLSWADSGDSAETSGCLLLGNTVVKSALGATRAHTSIGYGSDFACTANRIISTTYSGGATPGVTITGSTAVAYDYDLGWTLTPTITGSNVLLAGAAITLTDGASANALASPLATTTTDGSGHPAISYGGVAIGGGIPVSISTTTIAIGGGSSTVTHTPHTLGASKTGYTPNSTTRTLSADLAVTLNLAGPAVRRRRHGP